MRYLLAHMLGIDKALIQERMRSVSLESELMEVQESRRRLYERYMDLKKKLIQLEEKVDTTSTKG